MVAITLFWTRNPYALISFGVCAFVTGTIVFEFYKGVHARRQLVPGTSVPQALWTLFARNRRRYGGFVVHFGVVVTIIGITVSSNFAIEKEVRMARGEVVHVGDYDLRYDGSRSYNEVYRQVVWTDFTVQRDGREVTRLAAGKSFHPNEQQPIAQVGIRSTPWEDLYITSRRRRTGWLSSHPEGHGQPDGDVDLARRPDHHLRGADHDYPQPFGESAGHARGRSRGP